MSPLKKPELQPIYTLRDGGAKKKKPDAHGPVSFK